MLFLTLIMMLRQNIEIIYATFGHIIKSYIYYMNDDVVEKFYYVNMMIKNMLRI